MSYLAPAKIGSFVGEARVVQIGKTIAFVEAKLMDADGTLVATATTSARVIDAAKLAAQRCDRVGWAHDQSRLDDLHVVRIPYPLLGASGVVRPVVVSIAFHMHSRRDLRVAVKGKMRSKLGAAFSCGCFHARIAACRRRLAFLRSRSL